MVDINKIPESPTGSNSSIEITATPTVIVNPSNLSAPDTNNTESKNKQQSQGNIENEIFFLTFPKTCFQFYGCKNCQERMINCSVKENIEDREDGHKTISFKLCHNCIRENLRIFHIIKGM